MIAPHPAFSRAVYREKNYDVCAGSGEHVRIPGNPPMGSRIRMEMTPWLSEHLNCFSDATTERIVLMSPAQVEKTLSALCRPCGLFVNSLEICCSVSIPRRRQRILRSYA